VRMSRNNLPQAIAACTLENVSTNEKKTYFVVGTAIELSVEDEPKEGFIQVYEVNQVGGRLRVHRGVEITVPGSVYCVDECDGKLVAGVGSTVTPNLLPHFYPPSSRLCAIVCLMVGVWWLT
jgi:CPSF A subunit region